MSGGALWLGWGDGWEWDGVLAGVFDPVCNCRKPARSGRRPERRGTLLVRLVFGQIHILDRSRVLVGLGCGFGAGCGRVWWCWLGCGAGCWLSAVWEMAGMELVHHGDCLLTAK